MIVTAQQEAGVHGLISASPTGDWSYGAAILTFAFPMILFIAVGAALYVLYTTPHLVPGHRYQVQIRPPVAGTPVAGAPGQSAAAPAPPAAGGQAASDTEG
jgi:hypothetical protein